MLLESILLTSILTLQFLVDCGLVLGVSLVVQLKQKGENSLLVVSDALSPVSLEILPNFL
jgi:hypothetical protein